MSPKKVHLLSIAFIRNEMYDSGRTQKNPTIFYNSRQFNQSEHFTVCSNLQLYHFIFENVDEFDQKKSHHTENKKKLDATPVHISPKKKRTLNEMMEWIVFTSLMWNTRVLWLTSSNKHNYGGQIVFFFAQLRCVCKHVCEWQFNCF